MPDRNFAEFETGTVTLNVLNPAKMGIGEVRPNANHIALHVEDVEAARSRLDADARHLSVERPVALELSDLVAAVAFLAAPNEGFS